MATIAFIPVRGGSKSIPLKNIKLIAGRPLIWWSLLACENSNCIDVTIVATDSDEIVKTVESFNFKKVFIYRRQSENAQDNSSTESVMLEYLSSVKSKPTDFFILVQATNPFTTASDFDLACLQLKKNKTFKSLLSVVKTKRFFWDLKAKPINYDPARRPRRQDYDGLFMENGAFYISTVGQIQKAKNRIPKPILPFEMGEHSGFEIDEPDDWTICEALLLKYRGSELKQKNRNIKIFLSDVDGVLTDAGMYYSENGDELKKFNTYDGMAFKLMREQGLKVGIVTAEDRLLNVRRAEKLKLDYHFHGVSDKVTTVETLIKKLNLSWDNVAYIGDDLNDVELLKKVGLPLCPANATQSVKIIPQIKILSTSGGNGALREAYELFIKLAL